MPIKNIVFMGTPEFAVPCLEILNQHYNVTAVYTQPDRPKGRGQKLAMSPVKEYALKHNLPVYQPEKIKTPECVAKLRELKPDLIIVVAFGQILSKEILDIPPLGCVNVHGSLLPRWRGAAPIHWSIISGDKQTGITTMYMDVGLDTGDMILKATTEITPDMTTAQLHDKLMVQGADLLLQTVQLIEENKAPREKQDDDLSCYAKMLNNDNCRIDWTKSAQDIHNLVRGLNSWPVAYTTLNNKKFKIWQTKVTTGTGNPGQIIKITKQSIFAFLLIFYQFYTTRKIRINYMYNDILKNTKKRLFIKLATISLFSIMFFTYLIIWLCYPRLVVLDLDFIAQLAFTIVSIVFIFCCLFILNMIFNIANIKAFSFLDKYIFNFINFLFPIIILWGKIFGIGRREIERSFIALNNYILTHKNIKVEAKDLLVISPHCLQLATCPHKITHDINNCKHCNQCTIGPLIDMANRMGFHFRVATGGTLARKIAKELRPKMLLAIACERDLTSGIQDVYPLPAAGVLNIRPNGPCYNTTVDLELVEQTIKQFIK